MSRLQHLIDILLWSNLAPTLIQNVVKTKHLVLNTYVLINHVLKHHFLPNYKTTNFILTKSLSRAMLSFTDSTGFMTGSNFFFTNICYFNTFQDKPLMPSGMAWYFSHPLYMYKIHCLLYVAIGFNLSLVIAKMLLNIFTVTLFPSFSRYSQNWLELECFNL